MNVEMLRCPSRFAFILVCALFPPNHVEGQQPGAGLGSRAGSTELTAFGGLSASTASERNGLGLEVKTEARFGGRIAYNFTAHQAAEFSIANPFPVTANYVYGFPAIARRWVPYATAGIGGSRNEIALSDNRQSAQLNSNLMETDPDRSQTAFTGNFGGGLKYLMTDKFGLRFDVRDEIGHYRATFSNVVGAPGGIVSTSKTLNNFQITGGIVFRFGGER